MPLAPENIRRFRHQLTSWYRRIKRDLPWRREADPYRIWISEIMLQQTRVAAVIPYYERFLTRYPDYRALAESPEADLLSHWAGLGYYHRARNLQRAAQVMVRSGGFPREYHGIRDLPGIGDYTAAAVASIGFNLPYAVVDGNVFRVLSRLSGDGSDISSAAGKTRFRALADELLDRASPGDYNQALMELGATLCLPKNPQCLLCPVAQWCVAREAGRQNELPVKVRRNKPVEEQRTVYWIEREGAVLLWQRPSTATLMPGFWELPEGEQMPALSGGQTIGHFRHGITFHDYRFTVKAAAVPEAIGPCVWISLLRLTDGSLPLSTVVRKAHRAVKGAKRSAAAGA